MKMWMKIGIGIAGLGLIAAFLVYHFVYNKQHPDYEKMDADFTMTAQELYQAFKEGSPAASAKYNGKVIALTGTLGKMETADSLVTAVFIFNRGDFGDEGVRCTMLPKYNVEAAKLQPDGEVRVKGYCTGFTDTDVILEKCSVINQ